MGLWRLWLGALAVFGFVSSSHSAAAEEPGAPGVILDSLVTHSRANRGNQLLNTQLNAADCNTNEQLNFPLTISGSQGHQLQIWAGTDCDLSTVRLNVKQEACWQLGALSVTDGELHLPLPVQEIVYGRTAAFDPTLRNPAQLDPALACQDRTGADVPQALNVYFMLVHPALMNVAGTFATWTATYKLIAPPPPDSVAAGIGDEELVLKFNYSSPSVDTSIIGYKVYCGPAPGVSHEGRPSAADPGVCQPSSVLVAGADSSSLSAQRCGSAAHTASTATAVSLSAGVAYNVAMTAVDSYQNESVLSPVVCEVPDVKAPAKGQTAAACAFSRRGQTPPLFVLFVLFGVAAFLVARRQRCRMAATVASL